MDDWVIALQGPCATDVDCDDADACTTETCDAGICRREPLDCDDGCTVDSCAFGVCQSNLAVDFASIDAKIVELIAVVEGRSPRPSTGARPCSPRRRR